MLSSLRQPPSGHATSLVHLFSPQCACVWGRGGTSRRTERSHLPTFVSPSSCCRYPLANPELVGARRKAGRKPCRTDFGFLFQPFFFLLCLGYFLVTYSCWISQTRQSSFLCSSPCQPTQSLRLSLCFSPHDLAAWEIIRSNIWAVISHIYRALLLFAGSSRQGSDDNICEQSIRRSNKTEAYRVPQSH